MPKLKSVEEVSGYKNLSEIQKELFAEFLCSYYSAWEYPERWIPTKVHYTGEYLRVDFKNGIWLHVIDANTWC